MYAAELDPADAVGEDGEPGAIVVDPATVACYQLLRRLARSSLAVLITGETGAGKERAAHAVHAASARSRGPFVAVNCAAIPETLIESELFGYDRGGFSGADRAKPGLIERAHGGTLLLDEVCELPAVAQAKLLRALEARSVVRLGGVAPIAVDFRLVAATNRDVTAEVVAGRFREDLYYRIAAAVVDLPPLRQRPRDIPVLARAFLRRACARLGRSSMTIASDAMQALAGYRFPGNVRELLNAMEFAAATTSGAVVERCSLPPAIARDLAPACAPPRVLVPVPPPPVVVPPPPEGAAWFRPIGEEIAQLERRRMQEALAAAAGNQSHAATLIGMPRRTFVSKLRRYRLAPDRTPGSSRSLGTADRTSGIPARDDPTGSAG